MKSFDIIITIGCDADNEDLALDTYSDILFYIHDNLPMDNYKLEVKEKGEYL